ncbi:MAG: OmpH family outer membrane protein [Spirochaetales bacterium]|nr:OmpH family outer membrane protein [Spirochaetales bacterium]
MKKYLCSIIMLVMAVAVMNASNIKLEKIGIINLDLVMETIFTGKSKSMQAIAKEKKEFKEKLAKLEENINLLREASLKEKDEQRKILIDKKLEETQKQYSDYYKVTSYKIEQKVKSIQGPILKEIYDVVQRISEKEGYSLIMEANTEGIFYYSVDSDITQKVVDFFNNAYKAPEE